MTNTIPGGYYIGTDGVPHDANGNPILEAKSTVVPEPPVVVVEWPLGEELVNLLVAADFTSPEAVAQAPDEQLLSVDNIGPKRLEEIRAAIPAAK